MVLIHLVAFRDFSKPRLKNSIDIGLSGRGGLGLYGLGEMTSTDMDSRQIT